MVGFNVETPVNFHMKDSHILYSGLQQFTYKVKVVPTDWGDRAKFTAYVNMGPKIQGAKWEPTASDHLPIEVVP